jgi:hypothetical protein
MMPTIRLACLAALVAATPTYAADPEAALTRLDVETPEYFADLGLRVGPVTLSGAGGLALGYDSNVYAAPDAQESALTRAQLALRADRQSATREFAALVFGEARRYDEAPDQDAAEFGAATRFTATASRDEIELWLSGQRRFERRTELETPTALARSRYDDVRAGARHTHTFNRLSLATRLDAQRFTYAADSQSFRDRDGARGELRANYAFGADWTVFLAGGWNRDEFEPGSTLVSADTASGTLGLRVELTDLLELELGAGGFERRFDGDVAPPLSGVLFRGALGWQPTRLSRIRAELSRADEPTLVPGAFAKIRNELAFTVDHDFSRSIALFASARAVLDEFDTGASDATLWAAELGASWAVRRRSMFRFSYGYGSRSADTLDRDFVRHVASVSFLGRL